MSSKYRLFKDSARRNGAIFSLGNYPPLRPMYRVFISGEAVYINAYTDWRVVSD